jgi:hypothetical protein
VDPQNIVFEKEQGRNASERAQILENYLGQHQNWNRHAHTRDNPLTFAGVRRARSEVGISTTDRIC